MAAFIITVPAVIFSVYTGRESAVSAINEQFSEISKDSDVTVSDVLTDTDSYMPSEFLTEKAESVNTITRKKYTEYSIKTSDGSITVRNYNYAYLTEDEPVKIPDDAKKIMWNNHEIFIYKDKDGYTTALYYNNLSRYIIKDNCSLQQLENIFTEQP
ncbi:MAG: hypothetical protein J6Q94_04920 [Clostridia bacterium]|nr:hypothetical protein [Clostridia bacterium]